MTTSLFVRENIPFAVSAYAGIPPQLDQLPSVNAKYTTSGRLAPISIVTKMIIYVTFWGVQECDPFGSDKRGYARNRALLLFLRERKCGGEASKALWRGRQGNLSDSGCLFTSLGG